MARLLVTSADANIARVTTAPTAERECTKAVTAMGDSIIFMGGIAVGSLITIFICMVAIISDDIRRWKEKEREFRQEDEDY